MGSRWGLEMRGYGRLLLAGALGLVLLFKSKRRGSAAVARPDPQLLAASPPDHPSSGAGEKRADLTQRYWFRVLVEGVVIGGIVAAATVLAAARIDDKRSERELQASERLGWRVTLATADSFQDTDFSAADLSGFQLRARDFSRASFLASNLSTATLTGSDLVDANLENAVLTGATLSGATLLNATLTGATLEGANMTMADLSGVDLTRAESLPGLSDLDLCYDAATRWPAGNGPGRLDWTSCWDGFDDSTPPTGEHAKPVDTGCDFDDVLKTAFSKYPAVTEDQACAYLAYLGIKDSPGLDTDRAITGGFICQKVGDSDMQDAYTFARIIDEDPTALESKNVLLAAVTLLCPEYSSHVSELLNGFK